MKQYYFYLLLFIINLSCSNEQNIDNDVKDQNNPPSTFSVKVDSITHESAYLSWEKSTDPEGDEVRYDITLQGNFLLKNSNSSTFKINNLKELSNYSGEVIAHDIYGNITKTNFTFSTIKYYLKYLKKYSFPQTNYGGVANQILNLRDGNYLILGMTRYLGIGRKLSVIKVDKLGNEIWNKMLPVEYIGNGGGFNMKMIQCNSSDNVIIGAGANVSKIDFDGNILWVKNLPAYNVSWTGNGIESLAEDANNNFYVIGHTKSTDSHKLSAGNLVKLDSNGNLIFEKIYENSLDTKFNDIIFDDQRLIILGTKEIGGITWDQYLSNNPLKIKYNIIFTDLNGNIVNEKNYDDFGYAFAKGIIKKSNGNFVFYGYSSLANYITNIYEINSAGNIIWKKDYDYGTVSSLKESSNGNLVVIGMGSGYYYTRTFIYLNDSLGNTIWMKNFYEMGMEFFGQDVLADSDGGYRFLVTYGKSIKNVPEDYGRIYLYKTDSQGNY